jgi:hypothetical protein
LGTSVKFEHSRLFGFSGPGEICLGFHPIRVATGQAG